MESKTAEMTDWQSMAKTDVVAQILEVARKNSAIRQDTISSDAYLSRPQTRDYLSMMAENDLLKYDNESKSYRTTKKGDAFLKTYKQLGNFIELIDEEIGL